MRKKLIFGLVSGVGAACIALLLWRLGALDRIESGTWAWRVRAKMRPSAATENIKLILLDQSSLDWGRREFMWPWPWPREVYTAIIAYCRRGGARAIAFDVVFTEPSINGVPDDEALGAVIGEKDDVVGSILLSRTTGDARKWPSDIPHPPPIHAPSNVPGSLQHDHATLPIPEIRTNVCTLGDVSGDPDDDGIVRRIALLKTLDGTPVYSLGCATYLTGKQREGKATTVTAGDGVLRIGDAPVPIDSSGLAILRYRGPSQTHQAFNAQSVIQSEMCLREGSEPPIPDPAVFSNCFVFVGFSAPGLLDLRPTPISKVYPGVEIHATTLDNLLAADFMRDAPLATVVLWTLVIATAAALAIVFSRRAWQSILALAVCLPIPSAVAFAAYDRGLWWPLVLQTTAVLAAVMAGAIVNYALEGKQKLFLKRAFRFYLNPEVIERIIRDPSRLELGGERRELTILFSDLQGFSSFSERLDPEALTALLNDFLSEMTDIVFDTGGTLDKYEGDAIIAFWNAPLGQHDHARRAAEAAVLCQARLRELAPQFEARCGADLVMRIGMNTGEVVVGNMGSRQRFNYTVLGDAANLASRLEGANKAFGTHAMVSEATWTRTEGAFIGRELGRLRVVGRSTPVKVFELAGMAGDPVPATWAPFAQGLALCYSGKIDAALELFKTAPDDPPSQRYAEKCRNLIAENAAWDGIWNLTSK